MIFFSVNEVQWTDFVFRILNTHCYHRESLELHQAISALTIFLLLRLSQHEVFSWQAVLVQESSCVFEKTLPPYLYFLIRSDHRHKCESFDRCVALKKNTSRSLASFRFLQVQLVRFILFRSPWFITIIKTITLLALVGYEIIIANTRPRASLAI